MVKIGVDIGITKVNTTAIAIVDGMNVNTYSYPGPFDGPWYERVGKIASWAVGVVVPFNGHISSFQYESVFIGRNSQSTIKLATLTGALILIGRQLGIVVKPVSTKEAKLAVTGKGSAKKEEVRDTLQEEFGLKGLTFHETDAIAVALVEDEVQCQTKGQLG